MRTMLAMIILVLACDGSAGSAADGGADRTADATVADLPPDVPWCKVYEPQCVPFDPRANPTDWDWYVRSALCDPSEWQGACPEACRTECQAVNKKTGEVKPVAGCWASPGIWCSLGTCADCPKH
jgi:hypothetical protein